MSANAAATVSSSGTERIATVDVERTAPMAPAATLARSSSSNASRNASRVATYCSSSPCHVPAHGGASPGLNTIPRAPAPPPSGSSPPEKLTICVMPDMASRNASACIRARANSRPNWVWPTRATRSASASPIKRRRSASASAINRMPPACASISTLSASAFARAAATVARACVSARLRMLSISAAICDFSPSARVCARESCIRFCVSRLAICALIAETSIDCCDRR
mmetsp:Transcript_39302/g.121505  ORF Transcript_39302/g.121505 Transcript_39302/m.121505 type:complete len:227 (-) Transcript_39302:1754-2434(-)